MIVKKYAMTVTTLKKITPHKLRSTYGTSLYQETNDIYLVASVLGHSDVNTTKKHYAATNDYMLRSQRNAVKLREKLPERQNEPEQKDLFLQEVSPHPDLYRLRCQPQLQPF